MSYFKWDDTFSVFIGEMDNHHKKLFEIIDRFYEGLNNMKLQDSIERTISELKEYANYHFTAEEHLLEINNYPDLAQHKVLHKAFITKIEDYKQNLKAGKLVLTIELAKFLKEWLSGHIMTIDKKYVSFLVNKGVK